MLSLPLIAAQEQPVLRHNYLHKPGTSWQREFEASLKKYVCEVVLGRRVMSSAVVPERIGLFPTREIRNVSDDEVIAAVKNASRLH